MSGDEWPPTLTLNWQAQQAIYRDLRQRSQIEACGVLLGEYDCDGAAHWWNIEEVVPLANIANSAVFFEFDPAELLALEMQYPGRIVGVYHSHPTGYARASSTDRQNMYSVNQEQQIPWCWLIICGPFDVAFEQQIMQGDVPGQRMIAYHHYSEQSHTAYRGLVRLAVQLVEYPEAHQTG
jgi:Predicted metal-dependent protease of the PAD1/JAB1 superfamily